MILGTVIKALLVNCPSLAIVPDVFGCPPLTCIVKVQAHFFLNLQQSAKFHRILHFKGALYPLSLRGLASASSETRDAFLLFSECELRRGGRYSRWWWFTVKRTAARLERNVNPQKMPNVIKAPGRRNIWPSARFRLIYLWMSSCWKVRRNTIRQYGRGFWDKRITFSRTALALSSVAMLMMSYMHMCKLALIKTARTNRCDRLLLSEISSNCFYHRCDHHRRTG